MYSQNFKLSWIVGGIIALAIVGLLGFNLQKQSKNEKVEQKSVIRPIPVEVAAVRKGDLSYNRAFNGTIEPYAQFTVASKVGGILRRLDVDVSDTVTRGSTVAQMDDAEFEQEVFEAEARLAVAEANRIEAISSLEIAERELKRVETLHKRGVASDREYDVVQSRILTSQSAVKVAEANLKKEKAFLRATRIRLDYTRIRAEWREGDNERIVSERFVDEGHSVAANTPILTIIEIDPVIALIQVTEKDYPRIRLGQKAEVRTDAFPEKVFAGSVSSISPIFSESSRQARLELLVDNKELLLKPGMFVRCTLELDRDIGAISVPEMAITKRDEKIGVFRLLEDDSTVQWVEVTQGFTNKGQVQLLDSKLEGRVVTIGQQFIEDGSTVHVVNEATPEEGGKENQ